MKANKGEKIRFGVIGTNSITDWFLAGAGEHPLFEAVAVCSRTAERAHEFALKHGMTLEFTSVTEMAQCPDIDAVYIATPNSVHAEQAIECMRHGKHVLCEKPMASNATEAIRMVGASLQYGVLLMEAMIATLNPNFKAIKENLHRIGLPRRYFASYCQYSSRYDSYKRGIILNAFKPELSNGAIMDIGIYTIYPMVALFGRPKSIKASGIRLETGVDGQGTVEFEYPGMNATVIYSKIANSYLQSEIEGDEGNILIDKIQTPRSVTFIPRPEANSGRCEKLERENIGMPLEHDIYYYEVEEFIRLLLTGDFQSSINSHANSVHTLAIIDEIRKQLGVVFPADNPEINQ